MARMRKIQQSYGVFILHILVSYCMFSRASKHDVIKGDILWTADTQQHLSNQTETPSEAAEDVYFGGVFQHSATRRRKYLWINKTVPFELDSNIDDSLKRTIAAAIAEYHSKTCIRIVKRTTEKNWVKFTRGSKCLSSIGKRLRRGYQKIYLASSCDDKASVIHELMHTLGFWHEMSRPDRDRYVEILWDNIWPPYKSNFRKYSHGRIDTLGVLYDYNSLLHYSNRAFSKNGKPTVRALKNPQKILGGAKGFSNLDLIKLNSLYDCKGSFGGWSSWSGYSPCNSACDKYRQRFCYSNNRRKDCPLADRHGIETEVAKCSRAECFAPIDGHWSSWSDWSACSTTCGYGNSTRTRTCSDPSPKYGGKTCMGSGQRNAPCAMESRGPVYYRFMIHVARYRKCLANVNGKVVVNRCQRSSTSQTWAWSAYGQLVSIQTGLCLAVDGVLRAGASLSLSRCCKERQEQQWTCRGGMVRVGRKNLNMNYLRQLNAVRLGRSSARASRWEIFGTNRKNICSRKPVCKVKTHLSGCCVFPFKYRNKMHSSCIRSRRTKKLWCATSRNFAMDGRWGYCDTKDCRAKTSRGECCTFPFKFRNKLYNSCTRAGYSKRWCATTSNYDRDRKWGVCHP